MRPSAVRLLALPIVVGALAAASEANSAGGAPSWAGCCGLAPWAEAGPAPSASAGEGAGPLFQGFAGMAGGSAVRHHVGVSGGIPAQYAKLRNPVQPTAENAQRGAAVYEAQCASCHGVTGLGDGPASKTLNPPPAQLGWLNNVAPGHWDPFMYWTIAEGGGRFGTAMPAYKGKLSDEEIWSVIGYIQARLPKARTAPR